MKWLFVILLLLICPVMGSQSTSDTSVTLYGGAAIFAATNQWWEVSTGHLNFINHNKSYTYGSSELQAVTGPGNNLYEEKTVSDNSLDINYQSDKSLDFTGGGAYTDSYTMEEYIPGQAPANCDPGYIAAAESGFNNSSPLDGVPSHQRASVMYSGLGYDGKYETSGVIDAANLTTSARAGGQEGKFAIDRSYFAESGFNRSSTTLNYEYSGHDHYAAAGNATSDYQVAFDWKWRDYSSPFNTGNFTDGSYNLS